MSMIEDAVFAANFVFLYFAIVGFMLRWMMPRGRYLKYLQLKFFKILHNFFADEEEYIQHKVERIKQVTKPYRKK